jgi:hypothetical protein
MISAFVRGCGAWLARTIEAERTPRQMIKRHITVLKRRARVRPPQPQIGHMLLSAPLEPSLDAPKALALAAKRLSAAALRVPGRSMRITRS